MTHTTARSLSWFGRILFVLVALWWPPVWRDVISSPRYAQATGQELRLPDGRIPQNDTERAYAIFWRWEHRTQVGTKWEIGPYRGLRSQNTEGWIQTLVVLTVIVLVFNVILARWSPPPPTPPTPGAKKRGFLSLFCTPLWHYWQRPSKENRKETA